MFRRKTKAWMEGVEVMYWTLRKGEREVRTFSLLKMLWLRMLGWKVTFRFEGSE